MTKPPLAFDIVGKGRNTLVFAHGFTQTREAWRPVAQRLVELSGDIRCVLVDLPGHGASGHVSANVAESAAMLMSTGGRGIYVGYSLGARVVIEALTHSADASTHSGASVIQAAVLVSGTAGIEDAAAREARSASDDALATRLETVGVETFVREWLAQPLFADLDDARSQFAERITNRASGLADSLRRCSQGRQQPRWGQLAAINVPILAIAGAKDDKYVAIARRIAAKAPKGRLAIIAGAGHSAPLQCPDDVAGHIAEFNSDFAATIANE